jgi:TolB-like protein
MSNLLEELRRRNVIRVCIAYLLAAWLLLQVIDVVGPILHWPESLARYVLFLLIVGLIPAAVLAWVYEITPGGVRRESDTAAAHSVEPRGRKLDRMIMVTLALAVGFLLFDKLTQPDPTDGASDAPSQPGRYTADTGDGPSVATPAGQKSVAVLPFITLSSGPDDTFFSDGLTEEIINSLSQLPQLLVTARSSAFHFKGQNLPLEQIAGRLGVAHVVEGSVRRAGDRLRISAQLIRAKDGYNLWSESYDRRSGDTLAIQSDIAEKVATALNVVLDERLRQHMQRAGTRNTDAFIALQKGIALYERAHQELNQISLLRQANVQFEIARQQEPELVEAYQYHSDLGSHVLISVASGELEGDITPADLDSAPGDIEFDYRQSIRHARNRSQRYNAEFGQALLSGQWRGLEMLNRRALTSNTCEAPIWAHLAADAFGDAKLVLGAFQRMAACDPVRTRPLIRQASAYLWLRNPREAERFSRSKMNSSAHPSLHRSLAIALAAQGRHEEALEAANSEIRAMPDVLRTRSLLASLRGDANAARAARDQFLERFGPNDRVSLVLEAALGNRNEANRLASLIDARPYGYIVLLQAINECLCGAPFDLEAAPVLSAMLTDSGLEWPPLKPVEFPMKDW